METTRGLWLEEVRRPLSRVIFLVFSKDRKGWIRLFLY